MKYLIVGFLSVLLSGCSTWNESYAVSSLHTSKRMSIKHQSSFPEVMLRGGEQSNTFRIFTRVGDQFEIRDHNTDGSLIQRVPIPLFSDDKGLLRWYGLQTREFAVSPDGSQVVYFDLKKKQINLFDCKTKLQHCLITNTVSTSIYIDRLFWRSGQEIIIAYDREGGSAARLLMLSLPSRKIEFELRPARLGVFGTALSHNKRYLCYLDDSYQRVYIVYDIELKREVARFSAGVRGSVTPFWSPDDKKIVYVDQSAVIEFALEEGSYRRLMSWPRDVDVCLYGYEGGQVFYTVVPHARNNEGSSIYAYDVAKAKRRKVGRVNGATFVIPGGRYLVTGWGM